MGWVKRTHNNHISSIIVCTSTKSLDLVAASTALRLFPLRSTHTLTHWVEGETDFFGLMWVICFALVCMRWKEKVSIFNRNDCFSVQYEFSASSIDECQTTAFEARFSSYHSRATIYEPPFSGQYSRATGFSTIQKEWENVHRRRDSFMRNKKK